jgi:hypothetical protein
MPQIRAPCICLQEKRRRHWPCMPDRGGGISDDFPRAYGNQGLYNMCTNDVKAPGNLDVSKPHSDPRVQSSHIGQLIIDLAVHERSLLPDQFAL